MVGVALREQQGGVGVGPACDLVQFLHPDRHAAQRQRDVGGGGPLHHPVGVDEREGVQVTGLYRGQRRLGLVDR